MVSNARELLGQNVDEFQIIKDKVLNNSYFMHVEHIILGLLTDEAIG